jgi:hypothetical protein
MTVKSPRLPVPAIPPNLTLTTPTPGTDMTPVSGRSRHAVGVLVRMHPGLAGDRHLGSATLREEVEGSITTAQGYIRHMTGRRTTRNGTRGAIRT